MKFFFCARIGIYMMNKSKMEIFWTYMSRWDGKNPKTENMPPSAIISFSHPASTNSLSFRLIHFYRSITYFSIAVSAG